MFSTQSVNCIQINFVNIFDVISLFAAELEEPKIGIRGKGLKRCKCSTMIRDAIYTNISLWIYKIWVVEQLTEP